MIAALPKEWLRIRLLKITGVDFNGRNVRGNCERGNLRATSTARPFTHAGFAVGTRFGFAGSNVHANYFSRGHGMSALGQKQTSRRILVMSALPPKATADRRPHYSCLAR